MKVSNEFKSIELDVDKKIAKINEEEMYPYQNKIVIHCYRGKWYVDENIDVFYHPRPIKSKD